MPFLRSAFGALDEINARVVSTLDTAEGTAADFAAALSTMEVLLEGIPEASNGSAVTVPYVIGPQNLTDLPGDVEGLVDATAEARELLTQVIGSSRGQDLGSAITGAVKRAMESVNPLNALIGLMRAIQTAYVKAALNCPVVTVRRLLLQEFMELMRDVVAAARAARFEIALRYYQQ